MIDRNCFYLLDDFKSLEKLIPRLHESRDSDLLINLASKFESVGLCGLAVEIHLKLNQVEKAIQCCVKLNQWTEAIQLAKQYDSKEIESLLKGFATLLLNQGKRLETIELYRKANYCFLSAELLYTIALEQVKLNRDPLLIKKLFILGALELQRHYSLTKIKTFHKKSQLSGLMESPWKGALAFHFYILAQKQYYAGRIEYALYTALHLKEYDDILSEKIIFSLLALISFQSQNFGTCSKAFVKLESMTDADQEEFEELAVSIFTK